MDDPTSLVNLGELVKPATLLIEKVSNAIGVVYEPLHIKRVARAEAEAEKIRAVTRIEITALERRAMTRFFAEEAKKQENMEAIIGKALPGVREQARPEQVEDDWISHFFDKCRLISDEKMQSLWGQVLAGQANSPGSYSKRTVDVLSNLERVDAILFSKLCSFGFDLDPITPLIYDLNDSIYTDYGIDSDTLAHLASLGLVQFTGITKHKNEDIGQEVRAVYFDKKVYLEFQRPDKNALELGYVLFTQAGRQLAPISGALPRDGFVEYVQEKWNSFGYKTQPGPQEPAPENKVPPAAEP